MKQISVSRESFRQMSTDSKLDVLYDVLTIIQGNCESRCAICDGKFRSLGLARIYNASLSALAGFLGGFAAALTKGVHS